MRPRTLPISLNPKLLLKFRNRAMLVIVLEEGASLSIFAFSVMLLTKISVYRRRRASDKILISAFCCANFSTSSYSGPYSD